jgi:hypothetical protein
MYRLSVTAELGVARAETTVPTGGVAPDTSPRTALAAQTVRLVIPPGAASPLLLFSDGPSPGRQAVIDIDAPSIFAYLGCAFTGNRLADTERSYCFPLTYPGFTQSVVLASVDSNYRNFVRGTADPLGSVDRTNSIQGGVGVFGAVVVHVSRRMAVVAPVDELIEGRFVAESPPRPGLPPVFSLYLMSDARPRPGQQSSLSGNYEDVGGRVRGGIVGVVEDSLVLLNLLPGMQLGAPIAHQIGARFSGRTLRVVTVDRDSTLALYRRR